MYLNDPYYIQCRKTMQSSVVDHDNSLKNRKCYNNVRNGFDMWFVNVKRNKWAELIYNIITVLKMVRE